MALPQAIQRLEDEANAITQQLQTASADAETVVTDASQLTPANEPPAEPQPTEPAPQPAAAKIDDFEQRWRTLQGKYNAEVPRLTRALHEAQDQLRQMSEQLAQIKDRSEQQPQQREAPVADPKDIENFGADLVDMVNRQSEKVYTHLANQLSKQIANFDARIKALEDSILGVSQKADTTLEQQFYAALGGLVPDWEKINADERWLQWLAEIDPIYGVPRQAALDAAHKALDPRRVANVFNAFKSQFQQKAAESLSAQVAPSGAATPVPSAPAAKPVLANKFIETFYNDLARGRYAGREQEAQRIEAEIESAVREGRVR